MMPISHAKFEFPVKDSEPSWRKSIAIFSAPMLKFFQAVRHARTFPSRTVKYGCP
jgi:hypothetical protein